MMKCSDIERKLALDQFSEIFPHSFISEYDLALQHFKYECLGYPKYEHKSTYNPIEKRS